jgi:hypothetical protein
MRMTSLLPSAPPTAPSLVGGSSCSDGACSTGVATAAAGRGRHRQYSCRSYYLHRDFRFKIHVLIFILVLVTHLHTTYTHIPCMQTPKRSVRLLVEEGRLLERKSHRRLSSHPSMTLSRLGHSRHTCTSMWLFSSSFSFRSDGDLFEYM